MRVFPESGSGQEKWAGEKWERQQQPLCLQKRQTDRHQGLGFRSPESGDLDSSPPSS